MSRNKQVSVCSRHAWSQLSKSLQSFVHFPRVSHCITHPIPCHVRLPSSPDPSTFRTQQSFAMQLSHTAAGWSCESLLATLGEPLCAICGCGRRSTSSRSGDYGSSGVQFQSLLHNSTTTLHFAVRYVPVNIIRQKLTLARVEIGCGVTAIAM